MPASRRLSYRPTQFPIGVLKRAFSRIAFELFGEKGEIEVTIFEKLPDGTEHSRHNQPIDSIVNVCDLSEQNLTVRVDFTKSKSSFRSHGWIMMRADSDGFLGVSFDVKEPESLEPLIAEFQRQLSLTPTTAEEEIARKAPTIWEAIEELEKRVERLEKKNSSVGLLRCFLSFQFEPVSIGYSAEVKQVLELFGLEVITGQGYEPKRVSDKVRERLSGSIDLIILIEVAGKKSSWTRDEIARAQDPNVALIPLVEEGGSFDSGIFGDHEYISFPTGHISNSFVRLLEGIRYIAAQKMPPTVQGH